MLKEFPFLSRLLISAPEIAKFYDIGKDVLVSSTKISINYSCFFLIPYVFIAFRCIIELAALALVGTLYDNQEIFRYAAKHLRSMGVARILARGVTLLEIGLVGVRGRIPRGPENFRKFSYKFLRKLLIMHYFIIFFKKIEQTLR